MKTNKFFIKYFFIILIASLGIMSCSSDDKNPASPEPKPTTSKSVIVAAMRVNTPSGRNYYMGAYSGIPKTFSQEKMIELGSKATVYAYKEHPYVWDGSASTLTKYDVSDDLKIIKSNALSLSSTGISGGIFGSPAFVSDTEAYFFALTEGKIIAFNPETMTITKTIEVTPLEHSNDPNIGTYTLANYITPEGKIILPVGADGKDFNKFPKYAQIAVFDVASKTLKYVKDSRMSIGYTTFAKGNDGSLYYKPSRNIAHAEDYSTVTDHPTTGGLLKVNPDGTFDPNFFVDLKAALKAHSVNVVVSVFDGKALTQYLDASFTPPANLDDWDKQQAKTVLVDLKTLKAEDFSSFEQYGTVYEIGTIDGVRYYGNFKAPSGKFSLLKQKSSIDFESVSEAIGGSLLFIGKLR